MALDTSLSNTQFKTFQVLAKKLFGINLSEGKKVLVSTRLVSRIKKLKLLNFDEYIDYLLSHQDSILELQEFINSITTNETYFYREEHHFELLMDDILPNLIKNKAQDEDIFIWSSACSSGEEPYSIALTVCEFYKGSPQNVKILASDINTFVLGLAAKGEFTIDGKKGGVPQAQLTKYFEKLGDHKFRAKSIVKNLIKFKQINLFKNKYPIKSKLDIIFCRNIMIYFDDEMREHVLNMFYHHLKDDGILIMGHSENLFKFKHLFELKERTVYRKVLK